MTKFRPKGMKPPMSTADFRSSFKTYVRTTTTAGMMQYINI